MRPGFSSKYIFSGLRYIPGSTVIFRLHPLVKLLFLLVYTIGVFAWPQPVPGLILFGLLLALYGLAGLGMSFFLGKLRFILVFGIMILLVQVAAVQEGTLLWQTTLFAVMRLQIWSKGLEGGLVMMLRFINIIGSSYLFITTTDPNRLVYGLMQTGLPYRQGFMLITSLRFMPVFNQELTLIRNAQMAKGIDLEGVSWKKMLQAVKYLLTPLVICALNKVDYLAVSMESRAFGLYPTRTYLIKQELRSCDWMALILTIALGISLFSLFSN